MTTGTGTGTHTITRQELLVHQLNLIVQSTTGSTTFKSVIQKGIEKRWIRRVIVNGLTKEGKIRQQIEVEIDWNEHILQLKEPDQGTIKINLATAERNWVSRVIGQVIDGFNEINEQGDLRAEWAVLYTPEAMSIETQVDRELGLTLSNGREWDSGRVELVIDRYSPKKLSEAQISWKVVTKS
jgi:hypothetical protein